MQREVILEVSIYAFSEKENQIQEQAYTAGCLKRKRNTETNLNINSPF